MLKAQTDADAEVKIVSSRPAWLLVVITARDWGNDGNYFRNEWVESGPLLFKVSFSFGFTIVIISCKDSVIS